MVHLETKSKSMLYAAMIDFDNADSLNSLPEIVLFDGCTKIGKAWTEDGKDIPEEVSTFVTITKDKLLHIVEGTSRGFGC